MAAFHDCKNLSPQLRFFPTSHPVHQLSQKQSKPTAHQELLSSLTRIIRKCPPSHPPSRGWAFSGLYKGPTSTAYLFLQLSELYPDLQLQGKSVKEWCLAYLTPSALTVDTHKLDPSHCGIANETLVHTCVLAVATHDAISASKLCSYAPTILAHTPDESEEWLYGRVGYLYLLRRTRCAFSDNSAALEILQTTIDAAVSTIVTAPRPWKWRGKEFIGAAHGALGIPVQLVLTTPSVAPQFQDLLTEMLSYQLPTGNFPISPIKPKEDIFVQFCHGSPGAALALISLRQYYPELHHETDAALEKTTQDIWSSGLLVKEPCLCHGISSNALALVGDREKFEYFVSLMTEMVLEEVWGEELGRQDGDEACSLYCGEAGRAWVWAVADQGMRGGCIGFDDV